MGRAELELQLRDDPYRSFARRVPDGHNVFAALRWQLERLPRQRSANPGTWTPADVVLEFARARARERAHLYTDAVRAYPLYTDAVRAYPRVAAGSSRLAPAASERAALMRLRHVAAQAGPLPQPLASEQRLRRIEARAASGRALAQSEPAPLDGVRAAYEQASEARSRGARGARRRRACRASSPSSAAPMSACPERPARARAAAAALLVLLGCAAESGPQTLEDWEHALASQQPLSAHERLAKARTELRAARWERIESVHRHALETAWRLWQNSSPMRIWSGARRVVRRSWRLRDRGTAEESALRWLEPGLAHRSSPQLEALYQQLRARELAELAEELREAARAELERGRLAAARRLLARAQKLAPETRAQRKLAAALAERERAAASVEPQLALGRADSALAEALLAGEYRAALALGEPGPQTEFAHAAAQLLLGERDAALQRLSALEQRRDALGATAARWREQPEIDAQGPLERAVRRYQIRRLLGWIGGSALAERGSALSRNSLSAWKDSLTPMNLALSLPARIARGWKPDGREVREAAFQYLDRQPSGEHAELARRWLDFVGWPRPDPQIQGGSLLRAVQTPYERIGVPPVIVSRGALQSELVSASLAVRSALEGHEAVWLRAQPASAAAQAEGFALGSSQARRLLDELAFAVERGQLGGTLGGPQISLERLQRLDAALRRGWLLFAQPWRPERASPWQALAATVIDGQHSSGRLALERGENDVVAARALGEQLRDCPRGVLCLQRQSAVRSALFAYAHVEAGPGLGLQVAAGNAGVSLGLSQSGPEAALFLPLGRWLGIEHWIPIEAELSISTESIYAGPVLRKRRCSEDRDPDEVAVQDLLPFGVRSRCAIRLD